MIGIISYGIGNVASVANALGHAGVPCALVTEPAELKQYRKLLLPGVGAFGKAMERLRALGFAEAVSEAVLQRETPLLGICLGMQLLASRGYEFGETEGLGLIDGSVRRLDTRGESLRLPHIGWNDLTPAGDSPLLAGLPEDATCYFAHSYVFEPADPGAVQGVTEYGGPQVAVVAKGCVYGTQFHPEKSQESGLQILKNFGAL